MEKHFHLYIYIFSFLLSENGTHQKNAQEMLAEDILRLYVVRDGNLGVY